MPAMNLDLTTVSIIYATALAILLAGYYTAISCKDLIRLLIALELMFGGVFMALIPLFSVAALASPAFAAAIITIFTSGGELLILIAAIVIQDRRKKNIFVSGIKAGGERL